jgi:hypothetical protein
MKKHIFFLREFEPAPLEKVPQEMANHPFFKSSEHEK